MYSNDMSGSNTKQQVFYIHGGEPFTTDEAFIADLQTKKLWNPHGDTLKTWYQSLREDLGDAYEVFTPQMPNKQNAKYTEWKIWFERHIEFIHDDVILVGWSLGGIFLAKYIIENETPFSIKNLILLAAPFVDGHLAEGNGKSCAGFGTKSDITILSSKVAMITLMHSKDDFIVPYAEVLKYKEVFPDAELITFEDKNHFLVPELPELVAKIKEIAAK